MHDPLRKLIDNLSPEKRSVLATLLAGPREPVAIVGAACRLPGGVDTPDALWQLLRAGGDAITDVPDDRWPADAQVDPHLRRGGFLARVDGFDPAFFNIVPPEARRMDPQQRLLLEVCWEALEHAGQRPEDLAGTQTGVFVGMASGEYLYLQVDLDDLASIEDAFLCTGNAASMGPGRLSHLLDLRGPSLALDTACSSSLVAVHLACQSLRAGECSTALAGGVNLILSPLSTQIASTLMAMAPDGRCKPFSGEADGFVRGEGCGVVVLKRLGDALAAGDTIMAVIRGSAVNQDGRSSSLTAPNGLAQEQVVRRALTDAGVAPARVGFVETHGTGTALGDPIEVQALGAVLGPGRDQPLALGSIKANLGHLETAAGIASLLKAVLCLQHGELPPQINLASPSSHIPWSELPVTVPTALTPWPRTDTPRLAGVSAFGFSGTNAHVILEEAPLPRPASTPREHQLLTFSAHTDAALEQLHDRLLAHLERHPEHTVADVAYSLAGRASLLRRRALVCRDRDDAIAALRARDPRRLLTQAVPTGERGVVFMFPGLGEQYVGMARGLYAAEPAFRARIDECAALLSPELGFDFLARLYPTVDPASKPASNPASAPAGSPAGFDLRRMLRGDVEGATHVDDPEIAQPAIFAVEYALAGLLMDWGVRPREMIGYSIGEYTAACVAGVLTLAEATALVARRARLIQGLPRGVMVAVPLPRAAVLPLLGDDLSLSGSNADNLCVVSGPPQAIARLEQRLGEQGVTYRRLRTTHAFHSTMMRPIVAPFLDLVRSFRLKPPTIPYLSNVTGTWITAAQATSPAYWADHLCQEVRFSDGLAELARRPGRLLLEVGPGQTLGSFALQHAPAAGDPGWLVVPSLRSSYDNQPDLAFLLRAFGRLWQSGARLDPRAVFAGQQRRRLALPTYPFQRDPHWAVRAREPAAASTARRPLDHWFHVPAWRRATLPATVPATPPRRVLLRTDRALGPGLAERLRDRGAAVVTVAAGPRFARVGPDAYTLDPHQPEDYRSLLIDMQARGGLPDAIVDLWPLELDLDPGAPLAHALDICFFGPMFLAQILGELGADPLRITFVSTGLHDVTGGEQLHPERAVLLGPCRVIPQEYPGIACRSVDLEPIPDDPGQRAAVNDALLRDLGVSDGAPLVALRGGHRWAQSTEPITLLAGPPGLPLPHGAVVLITGGLGGVGLALAGELARAVPGVKLVLLGRTPLPEPADRDAWIAAHAPDEPTSARLLQLRALASSAEVLTLAADLTVPAQVHAAVAAARARFGAVHGLIHAAGDFGGNLVQLKTRAEANRVLGPKLHGLHNVLGALAEDPLDLVVLCSSLTGTIGGPGQIDYVAANAFLDAWAHSRAGRPGLTVSIAWDDWKEVGAAFKLGGTDDFVAWRKQHYKTAMRTDEALEVFRRILAARLPHVAVSTRDLGPRAAELAQSVSAASLARFGQQYRGTGRPRPPLATAYVAPTSELERKLVDLWQDLLGVQPIGIHDPFADLGGHSLVATQLISRLRDLYHLAIPLRRIFETPTVAELGEHIEDLLLARVERATPPRPAPPRPAPADLVASQRLYRLPNGLEIRHQNKAETDHFYDDIFVKRVYARNNIHVDDGGVVLDVGANIGMFTLFAAQTWPSARIYAFEPAPVMFEILRDNVARHGIAAHVFPVGLAARPGTATLTYYPNSTGMSSFRADLAEEKQVFHAILENQRRRGVPGMAEILRHADDLAAERFRSHSVECRLRTVSEILREQGIERVDLLKVDVQKLELEVLEGIDDLDWPRIRQLVLEVHDIDGGLERATDLLRARGFHVVAEQDDLYDGSPIYNLYVTRTTDPTQQELTP